MTTFPLPTIQRIAVIGAGPAGLVAAKQLLQEQAFESVTIFERNSAVGGTWIYSPKSNAPPPLPSDNAIKVDPPFQADRPPPPFERLHSAMHSSLHTNLPKNVMQYRDFDFEANTPVFPSHTHVLAYLQRFAQTFDLAQHIRLDTHVVGASYQARQWTLTLRTADNALYTETFDALVVATGHYSIPYIPSFPNLQALGRHGVTWSHSREYRQPEAFKDKTVLVVGSGSSGLDIVREGSRVAKRVFHCVRSDNRQSVQEHAQDRGNVQRVGLVDRILDNGHIQFVDGQAVQVDHVVFATGFLFSYPFLGKDEPGLVHHGESVRDLYQFLFHRHNPTLAFMAVPIRIVPLPLSQVQATVIARVWNPQQTHVHLPDWATMTRWYEQHPTDTHASLVFDTDVEFNYVDRLACWAAGYDFDDAPQQHAWRQLARTDPLTWPLSDNWKENRRNALALRKQHLGY
ncbi:FAD/NAD(P)-binding domain-containing protein [Hesseltinella vesiculosa]|uniref:FAD/NAD(P)-binding domain-containing protein n=1 Tax=Hesseltinella vesiculosa TaxID=101127 RepID=A0A1X2GXL0_9FUNG|nr:FAD/NAD(P)-binding domain-containing protein [Hesseltinella vesiculosa]